MKYYCDTIPLPLAEKLKEKGVFVEIINDYDVEEWPNCGSCFCNTTYAEVFDWLLSEKNIFTDIHLTKERGKVTYKSAIFLYNKNEAYCTCSSGTWHEAAEKAIEKALTLI